jgi:uncharacterized protein (TIGR03083 family)
VGEEELDFVVEYAAVAKRFAAAVARANLRAPVPACPSWSAYDLVVHLGNTHAWAATIVETGAAAPEQDDGPRSRRPRAVADWYASKAEDLFAVLRAVEPDAPCWNFVGRREMAGFWSRRQTHETGMHLIDLLQGPPPGRAGAAPELDAPIRPALAADGVAEVLEVFLPRMHTRGYAASLDAPLVLRCTDVDHAWTLTPVVADAPPAVTPGEAADSALRGHLPGRHVQVDHDAETARSSPVDEVAGSSATLWQLLWKRVPLEGAGVALTGDADRIGRFLGSRLPA